MGLGERKWGESLWQKCGHSNSSQLQSTCEWKQLPHIQRFTMLLNVIISFFSSFSKLKIAALVTESNLQNSSKQEGLS